MYKSCMNEQISKFSIPLSDQQRNEFGKVGVLFGGNSAEREISLKSGKAVLAALQRANVNAIGIDLQKNMLQTIQQAQLDRVFIVLHGVVGEDGRIQALLNFLELPFTGSAHPASALAMDKLRCKQLWRGIGLSTPEFEILRDDSDLNAVFNKLGGHVMVKPSHEGSSIGMSKVNSIDAFQAAYQQAKTYDTDVIAEKVISGPEYSVSILGDTTLPAIELQTDNIFYDYEAKYFSNETRYICPANLSTEKAEELAALALQAYTSIGCSGWGRVDVMSDQNQNFYVLEVNTVPGMTDHSLVPMAAKAVGLSFEQLVISILATTLADDNS